jgi:hypothetical protein
VTVPDVTLTAGTKNMKVVFDAGDFNVNYIAFSVANAVVKPEEFGNTIVYPNPMHNNSTLKLDLQKAGHTKVVLFDVTGNELAIIEDAYLSQGTYYIPMNIQSIPAGFYLCKVIQENAVMTIPLTKQ